VGGWLTLADGGQKSVRRGDGGAVSLPCVAIEPARDVEPSALDGHHRVLDQLRAAPTGLARVGGNHHAAAHSEGCLAIHPHTTASQCGLAMQQGTPVSVGHRDPSVKAWKLRILASAAQNPHPSQTKPHRVLDLHDILVPVAVPHDARDVPRRFLQHGRPPFGAAQVHVRAKVDGVPQRENPRPELCARGSER
jgi:hypothetical protein